MTPEGKVKDRVKRRLNEMGAYYHMPVQNGMGSPALDFHVCMPILITADMVGTVIGAYVGIETKAPGNAPTIRQLRTMDNIHAAHGIAVVIDGDDLGKLTDIKLGVRL